MAKEKRYYVYIVASKSRILCVGMTGFLMARVLQHKSGETDGFTKKYSINRLVYYESFRYVNKAIARETEVEWRREKKVALIEADSPTWEDLAADWGKPALLFDPFPFWERLPAARLLSSNIIRLTLIDSVPTGNCHAPDDDRGF